MAKLIYLNDEHDQEISIKLRDDADIYELMDVYEKLTFAIGYHLNSFKTAIKQKSEEYENE
ncbi:MAG: hypothetical protein ACTSWG_13210 [Candidatus Helarchaeota archaeon]